MNGDRSNANFWFSHSLSETSSISRVISQGNHLIWLKGNNVLELIRVESNGYVTPIHKQAIFSKIVDMSLYQQSTPEDGEEIFVGILLSSTGQVSLFRFCCTQNKFIITDSEKNWNHLFPCNGSRFIANSVCGLIATANHRGCMVLYDTKKQENIEGLVNVLFDCSSKPIGIQISPEKHSSFIWSLAFLNGHQSNILSCLVYISKIPTLQFYGYSRASEQREKTHFPLQLSVQLTGITNPYMIYPQTSNNNKQHIIIFSEGAIHILSEENQYQNTMAPIPLPDGIIMITGVSKKPNTYNEIIICSDNGTILTLNLQKRKIISNPQKFSSAGILQYVHEEYLLLCGSTSDTLMLQENEEKFEILYEIPNWSPLLDFCISTSENDYDKIFACGGTNERAEIVSFRTGIAMETLSSTAAGGYFGSITNVWSLSSWSNEVTDLIVFSFLQSTRVLQISKDAQMEDVSTASFFVLDEPTIYASGDIGQGKILQITEKRIILSSPSMESRLAQWTCDVQHGVITKACSRGNEILLSISKEEKSFLYFFRIVSLAEKFEIILIHSSRQTYEPSVLHLPLQKYCQRKSISGEVRDVFSVHEIGFIGTHKPALQIVSMTNSLRVLAEIDLGEYSSVGGVSARVNSMVMMEWQAEILLFVGLRDGKLLTFQLSYVPILESPGSQKESQDADMMEMEEDTLQHSFCLSFLSQDVLGTLPLYILPTFMNDTLTCIFICEQATIMKSKGKEEDAIPFSLSFTLIDSPTISHLIAIKKRDTEDMLLCIANDTLRIMQLNFAASFSYHRIVHEDHHSFPELTGTFKKIIHICVAGEDVLVVLSDHYLVGYVASTGEKISLSLLASKGHSLSLWHTENGKKMIIVGMATGIAFYEMQQEEEGEGEENNSTTSNSFSFSRVYMKKEMGMITCCSPLEKRFLVVASTNLLFVIEQTLDSFRVIVQESIPQNDVIRTISCGERGTIAVGCGRSGISFFHFDSITLQLTFVATEMNARMVMSSHMLSSDTVMVTTVTGSVYSLQLPLDGHSLLPSSYYSLGEMALQINEIQINRGRQGDTRMLVILTILGSVIFLIPLSCDHFQLLNKLQDQMKVNDKTKPFLGYTHDAYRGQESKAAGIIDGDFLDQFRHLEPADKLSLCESIQTTPSNVLTLLEGLSSQIK